MASASPTKWSFGGRWFGVGFEPFLCCCFFFSFFFFFSGRQDVWQDDVRQPQLQRAKQVQLSAWYASKQGGPPPPPPPKWWFSFWRPTRKGTEPQKAGSLGGSLLLLLVVLGPRGFQCVKPCEFSAVRFRRA